jgi:hypothetical protein
LEELAKEEWEVKDLTKLTFFFIDEPLLLSQETYFEYARDLIMYLNYEGRLRAGKISVQLFKRPPLVPKPAFYTKKA